MKRLFRHACAMLAVLIVMSMFTVVNASAANGTTIDTTNAKYGFVTVNYASNAKLKVGIQYGNEKTSYKNCPSGKDAVFSLEQGDGTYTISLCENISGTTYRVVTSKKVNAKIENAYAPYLIATTDVQFTSGDDVCKKAAELCKDAKTDMDKVTAIYNYIAGHYTYDTKLASDITSGKVSKYIPDTAAGRVAGRFHDAEGQIADLDLVALLIKDRALGRGERVAVEGDGRACVERVHVHGRTGLLVHGVDGTGVVVVAVREQDGAAGEVVVLEVVEDGVRLVAGVDDGALERGLVRDDVAVGHEVPDGQTFDEHGVASFINDRYRAGW